MYFYFKPLCNPLCGTRIKIIAFFPLRFSASDLGQNETMSTSYRKTIRVWDLPTRLFHWAFAACVIGAIVTVKLGGLWMDWHMPLGVSALALLVFRLIWGVIGPKYARFSQFVKTPSYAWRYLRGQTPARLGHNPLGGWSVLALLLAVGIQATTGLFATDDILTSGPLNAYVSNATAQWITRIHQWNAPVLLGLIALHLVAIFVHSIRGDRIVGAMISGNTSQSPASKTEVASEPARDDWTVRLGALLLALILAAAAKWLMGLGSLY
jgi:cytochrome b